MKQLIFIPIIYATAACTAALIIWSDASAMVTNEYQSPLSLVHLLFIVMVVLLCELVGIIALVIVAYILKSIAIPQLVGSCSLPIVGGILSYFLLDALGFSSQWTFFIPGAGSGLIWLALNRSFFGKLKTD